MRLFIVLTVAAMVLLASATASSASRILALQTNGTGVCQAALPSFEGLMRKRPMAIQNEGSAPAFVTCSPTTMQGLWTSEIHGHGIHLLNSTGASVLLACTAVIGARDGVATHTVTKAVQLPAHAARSIYWGDGEIPSQNGEAFNTTCALPPGTGIATVLVHQLLDIGE